MALWKDSETVVDYLNFDYIIDAVVNIVLDEELSPSSIGLYGDWGSGKSSLMKMVETRLNGEMIILSCVSNSMVGYLKVTKMPKLPCAVPYWKKCMIIKSYRRKPRKK